VLNRRKLGKAQKALLDEHGWRTEAETITANLRERLARFSKESSLGTMATTIAHEINQPLIAIQNYAQALKRRFQSDSDTPPKLVELAEKISNQAERAGDIVQHVRALVDQHEPDLRPVFLNPLILDVVRMMEPECEARECRITCGPAPADPRVLADALQIQLVLVNLLHNAMSSVCMYQINDRPIVVDFNVLDDGMVQVSVTDRGRGISADLGAQIFEPHFSEKSTGMGMGLSISHDIISGHGGLIWCEPNPEGGAIFRFTLRNAG
jgi:two-component system sensor kinase FixL